MLRWFRKTETTSAPQSDPRTLGGYRLRRKLGEGGMGVVYEAHDPRLDRLVAIKRLHPFVRDPVHRDRLRREARVAAGVSHPNICQVYELGEETGELYIVMELLSGETLAERIARGPLPFNEALQVELGILAALEALHARGVVHRDLKPSNVFLTPHGVKLLDFGVARPQAAETGITTPGTLLGTPRYVAPEMLEAEEVGPRADLFAAGAILFEMLSGKPAFNGTTLMEVLHQIAHGQPPALVGGPEVLGADRVIQRALAKRPDDRYPDAAAMARDVREALTLIDTGPGPTPSVRTATRLVVLPFRLLRPDPDIEFLAASLPEAITGSLAQLESVTVRSTAAAARWAGESPDLEAIARQANVDAVLMGTLLRAGDQVRVTTQLVEAPGGTLIRTSTVQAAAGDVFQLQDELTRQIVEALAIELTTHDRRALAGAVPTSAEAYELYLRANHYGEGSATPARLGAAKDLYLRCLELDPGFAPAWARLGRVHRVLAKYGFGDPAVELRHAEEAFRRALELNPELPVAHYLYTYFEIEERGRAKEAMLRLLRMVESRPADADLFAGLVVACRFCGLLEASLAADRRARRIDPGCRTSVAYTHWMVGDWERAALTDLEEIQSVRHCALWMMGRHQEALDGIRAIEAHWPGGLEDAFVAAIRAAMEGKREETVRTMEKVMATGFHDPEGLLFGVRAVAFVGETAFAIELLEKVVALGFRCPQPLRQDPWFDRIRTEPRFLRALRQVEEGYLEALAAFREAGGERILGVAG